MQLSLNVKPELYQQMEKLASFRGKPISDFVIDEIQSLCDEEQRANKALADFLEPTVKALNNGEVVNQTAEEIVKETLEEIAKDSK